MKQLCLTAVVFILLAALLSEGVSGAEFFAAPTLRRRRRRFRAEETDVFDCLKCREHGTCVGFTGTVYTACDCNKNREDGYWRGVNCDECDLGYATDKCNKACEGGSCNACKGHGVCLQGRDGDGSCQCFNNEIRGHWGGADCSTCAAKFFGPKCLTTCVQDDGQECNGHGRCTSEDGTCNCFTGWNGNTSCATCDPSHYGPQCEIQCDGYVDGRACSGHGLCNNDPVTGDGRCTCEQYWGMADCSKKCPNECSRHGLCDDGARGTATCRCDPNWAPPDCSGCIANRTGTICQLDCKKSVDGLVCSGHGLCTFEGNEAQCDCADGYTGEWCERSCTGEPPCSGHGVCRASPVGGVIVNECVCYSDPLRGFWDGATCDSCLSGYNASSNCNVSCPVDQNGVICGGQGKCVSGQCICNREVPDDLIFVDFCGAACNITSKYEPVPCDTCAGCGPQYCQRYRFGQFCNAWCPGAPQSPCSGRGTCDEGRSGTGKCTCIDGYTGDKCDLVCPMHKGEICSSRSHGVCTSKTETVNGNVQEVAHCECEPAFRGVTCEIPCPVVAGRICAGNGECLADATCQCSGPWTGTSCNVPCYCDAEHGSCNSTICKDYLSYQECDVCECTGNFTGKCNECRPGTQGQNCEGECVNGRTEGLICVCDQYWALPSCTKRCPEVNGQICSGNGTCQYGSTKTGTCKCNLNYYGEACTEYCTPTGCAAKYGLVNPQCNPDTGECECLNSAAGRFQQEPKPTLNCDNSAACNKCDRCAEGYWGPSCTEQCECSNNGACDQNTGECQCYDDDTKGHWAGSSCSLCASGFIGQQCNRQSVITTRIVGRNTTRDPVLSQFDKTDTLAIVNTKADPENDEANRVIALAGGLPLAVFDVTGENIEYKDVNTRDFSSIIGCETEPAEVAFAHYSPRYGGFFLLQPTQNCTGNGTDGNNGIKVVRWTFKDVDKGNYSFEFGLVYLEVTWTTNPIHIPDATNDATRVTSTSRVIAAVASDARRRLVFTTADFDANGNRKTGGFLVTVDMGDGRVLKEPLGTVTQDLIHTDVAITPFNSITDTVATKYIVAISGSSVTSNLRHWDVEYYWADQNSLEPFSFGSANTPSIRERLWCFPPELRDADGFCPTCANAARIAFFGESLLIAMDIHSSTLGNSTSLVWLQVAQHAAPGTEVIYKNEIRPEYEKCPTGVVTAAETIQTAAITYQFDGSCIWRNGDEEYQYPCAIPGFFVRVASSDQGIMSPTAMVVTNQPLAPSQVFNPGSGVVYVALKSPFKALSKLSKFTVSQERFGLYGSEELRLTSDDLKNDIPEEFSAMAIASSRQVLYAIASGVSKIRIASFLLYEVQQLTPDLADQRGGTNITVRGLGFKHVPGFKIVCAFEDIQANSYILVEAFNVSYFDLVCTVPTQNSTSTVTACEGQKVEVSLYGGIWETKNRLPLQRVQRAFLHKGGVTPDRGSMSIRTPVSVRGTGFVKSIYSRCKFYSDNPLSSQVLYSSVEYVSPNEVKCTQSIAQQASFDKSRLDVSLDGQLYSVATPPEYEIVGEATNILPETEVLELIAEDITTFTMKIFIVDSQNHRLGDLDENLDGTPIRRRVSMFSNVSESTCDPLLFTWRTEDDGYPDNSCRNISLNASLWSSNREEVADDSGEGAVYKYWDYSQRGEYTFQSFYFYRPRAGLAVLSVEGQQPWWRANFSIRILPGTAFGLAIENLQDFGDAATGRASKFDVKPQKPLDDINIIIVDKLGNIIDRNIQNYAIAVKAYYERDEPDPKKSINEYEINFGTPVFRIDNSRITFVDIYLTSEYRHGVNYYLTFSSIGLRPVTTPAIRTELCPITKYKVPLQDECVDCPPAGAICNGTEIIVVEPGYWRSNNSNIDIYECKGGAEVCPGSAAATDPGKLCSTGYRGPKCSLCDKDFGRSGATSCSKCENEGTTTAYVVLIGFAMFAVVLGWIVMTLRKDEVTDLSIIARTVVNHAQATGELGEFSSQFHPFLTSLFNVQGGASSFSISGVQALDCMLKQTNSNYTTVFFGYMSLPAVALGLGLFVFVVVRVLRLKPVITKALRDEIHRDIEALGEQAKTAVLLRRYPLYMVLITTLCVTMFTLYQTLITQSTSVLKCVTVIESYEEVTGTTENGGTVITLEAVKSQYMQVDMSLSCSSDEYNRLYTSALIFAVVYGFGVPIAFVFGYLFVNARIAKPELTKLMFTFLIGGYKERFWWWQAIIMIRKMVLVVVIVFIDNRQLQSYCGMWSMSVALILQIWFNPNEKDEHNMVEALSLAIITVTLNLSLLYFWPDMPDEGKGVLTAVLILITIGALIGFAYFLYHPVKETILEAYYDVLDTLRTMSEDKAAKKAEQTKARFVFSDVVDVNGDDEEQHLRVYSGGSKSGNGRHFGAVKHAEMKSENAIFDELEMREYNDDDGGGYHGDDHLDHAVNDFLGHGDGGHHSTFNHDEYYYDDEYDL